MTKILDEVKRLLPSDAEIKEACFEGANIILYTTNAKFFLNGGSAIKSVVDNIKKRIELRPDPTLVLDLEKTKKIGPKKKF